ncbi:hypothetical protein NM688_g8321 [Phlebia brevispora]|uniref:Uncharacterized protein n=1 Tax=Phlebia brevispora TaxID=194682 RepID=A0ACC1RUR0_9APHY|nr:hypothetical protein NM688_g8321 [Phlebia brevispora]
MAASKLFNLLTVTTLALFAASFNASPVTALSTGHQHLNRQIHHDGIAKRAKRSSTQRCKPRPSTSVSVAQANKATSTAKPASSSAAPPPKATSSTKKATPTTTSQAPAKTTAAASSGSSSANGKVGIAWNGGDSSSLGNIVSSNTHYIYTWSPYEPTDLYGLEFIPMLWGPNQETAFNQLVVPGYAKNLLFVNEPDQVGQSQMSPQDAANLWQQQFAWRSSQGYSLWSPAVTNAAEGETWMDEFLSACSGCQISHMALHFYDTSAQNFMTYVEHWHSKYGLPVVITEFACEASIAIDLIGLFSYFWQTVVPWLIQQDYVTAFFPFGFLEDMGNVNPDNQMMKNGQLTALGNYVVNGPY